MAQFAVLHDLFVYFRKQKKFLNWLIWHMSQFKNFFCFLK